MIDYTLDIGQFTHPDALIATFNFGIVRGSMLIAATDYDVVRADRETSEALGDADTAVVQQGEMNFVHENLLRFRYKAVSLAWPEYPRERADYKGGLSFSLDGTSMNGTIYIPAICTEGTKVRFRAYKKPDLKPSIFPEVWDPYMEDDKRTARARIRAAEEEERYSKRPLGYHRPASGSPSEHRSASQRREQETGPEEERVAEGKGSGL